MIDADEIVYNSVLNCPQSQRNAKISKKNKQILIKLFSEDLMK